MMTLYQRETSYGTPAGWTSTAACSMSQYDEASVEQWDDTVTDDADLITGYEMVTQQEIPRQSMRMQYTETRTKPNSVAGLLGLTLGTVATTQDGSLTAYRHKITPATSLGIPSVAAQTLRDGGTQYLYPGIKSDMCEIALEQAQPYIRLQAQLIGSGARATAVDAFAPSVTENWLRLGDAKLYLKNTAGTPISIPSTPSQTTANLGGSEVNISSRILTWTFRWNNNLQPDFWYRAGAGTNRADFAPTRRAATVAVRLQVDSATEAAELAYYAAQSQLALELNLNSGTVVASTGTFKYGFILLIPRVQMRPITHAQTNQLEDFQFEFRVEDDRTNPQSVGWVFTAVPAFLA